MDFKLFNISRICWKFFRVLLLLFGILLFMIVWFEFPLQQEIFTLNLALQKELDEVNVKFKHCLQNQREEETFGEIIDTKYKVPESEKIKLLGFQGLKLVHVDLKGAPPRIEYLLELIQTFKEMGAGGILLEYEDMFPYQGSLRIISSHYAYSYKDIEMLLAAAKVLNMVVIPLIQTLGHFEFVLKHDKFRYLRETPQYPNMPCPLRPRSQEIVLKMIDQVLSLHPDITRIHLGGDEVFNLKDCEECKASIKTKAHLYISHMLPIFKHVVERTNETVKPIIWDDMLRTWSISDMKKISKYTEVMVWGYVTELDNYSMFPDDMWSKYQQVFDVLWVASSFKGAIAANNNLVPITMHVRNHESWLRVLKRVKNKIVGIAITGWARYDHFATLCELLPAALPSLGLALSVLKEGSFKHRGKSSVETLLGFKDGIVIEKDIFGSWDTSIPNFPGGDVYSLVAELENHISWYQSAQTRFDSWGNARQVEERKISLLQINGVADTLKQLVPSFHNFRKKCEETLKKYFYDDMVNEWVSDKVDLHIALTRQLVERLKEVTTTLKLKVEL